MTDNEKLSCLIDRPCTACKFHKEEGCSKWSCVFEEKSDIPKNGSRYVRIVEVESVIHNDLHALIEKEQIDQLERDINGLSFITVPEREKGEWIDDGLYAEGHSEHAYRCSECGENYIGYVGEFKFCPNCGADMRGGKE